MKTVLGDIRVIEPATPEIVSDEGYLSIQYDETSPDALKVKVKVGETVNSEIQIRGGKFVNIPALSATTKTKLQDAISAVWDELKTLGEVDF